MNYAMELAASGVLTSLYRMDVMSNNLANVATAGFKPDMPFTIQRDAARVEDGLSLPSNLMLERLGGGVTLSPNQTNFEQGPMQKTGSAFDLAIEGDGFFVMLDERAATGERLRLARDGRFTRNGNGTLVSTNTGQPVLDVSNRPISVSGVSPVQIGPDGSIRQDGAVIAQIQVVSVPDRSRLAKVGNGMFRASAEAMSSLRPASGSVVDPIKALMGVTDAGKAAEANMSMLTGADRLMERAINGLGRVG
jgi:flagellar basal body rod protein FlgG